MCGLKRNYQDVFHNSGNHVQESFRFQIFYGSVALDPARGACCNASITQFSHLLSSGHIFTAFFNDNPGIKVDHLMVEMNLLWKHHHDQYLANFFSFLFKVAVSKLQILNMPIRTLLLLFLLLLCMI